MIYHYIFDVFTSHTFYISVNIHVTSTYMGWDLYRRWWVNFPWGGSIFYNRKVTRGSVFYGGQYSIWHRDQCIKYTHNSWSGEHFWHSWSQFLSQSLHIEYTMSFDEGTQHKSYAWLNSNMNIFLKFSWPFLIDPIESEYQYKRWLMNAFNECSIYSLNPTDDKRYGWFDGFFLKVLPLHRYRT